MSHAVPDAILGDFSGYLWVQLLQCAWLPHSATPSKREPCPQGLGRLTDVVGAPRRAFFMSNMSVSDGADCALLKVPMQSRCKKAITGI